MLPVAKIKWEKAKVDKNGKSDPAYRGIYYRVHPTRRFKVGSVWRRDRSYVIFYSLPNGSQTSEVIGWESLWEGDTTLLEEAKRLRGDYLANVKARKAGEDIGPVDKKERLARGTAERKKRLARIRRKRRENITVNQFWERTYFPRAQRDKSPKSWKTELGYFKKWIQPEIGDKPLKQVSQIDVERIKKELMQAGRSAGTVRYVLAVVRQIFNQANLSEANPTKRVKRPKTDNKRTRYLSQAEARDLLDELKRRSLQLHDMALVSLYSGLRFGEIAGLTWADVDLANGTLFIKDPKNSKNRHAFMTDEVKAVFMELEKRRDPEQPLVFPSRKGDRMAQASKAFNRALDKLKLNQGYKDPRQQVCFHTLRHTFASWLAERGVPMFTLAKLMGHSSTAMTERYSHLSPDNLRAAAMQLNGTLTIDRRHSIHGKQAKNI